MARPLHMSKWLGGKIAIARQLVAMLPACRAYVEVFGGMGSVLLNKPPAGVEIYNDNDAALVRVFLVVKYHYRELVRELSGLCTSRFLFEHSRHHLALTDIQRAAQWLYCQTYGFGGQGKHFGTSVRKAQVRLQDCLARWQQVSQRLQRVTIEGMDWRPCFDRYDRPDTCFFVDPPYWGTAGYTHPFTNDQHISLAQRLRTIKGKFLLMNSNCPDVRKLYRGFRLRTINTRLTCGSSNAGTLTHLLAANFPWVKPKRRQS